MTTSLLPKAVLAGLVGVAALAFTAVPSYSDGSSPKPKRCSQHNEGSDAWKRCMGTKLHEQTGLDQEATYARGYWLAKAGDYGLALDALRSAADQRDPRVQTMIGFSLRKLGMVEEAMAYYTAALATDPRQTNTRQYLGEAFLQQGDKARAREQLAVIASLCGTSCADYQALAAAIAAS